MTMTKKISNVCTSLYIYNENTIDLETLAEGSRISIILAIFLGRAKLEINLRLTKTNKKTKNPMTTKLEVGVKALVVGPLVWDFFVRVP